MKIVLLLALSLSLAAQKAVLSPAPRLEMPTQTDGNTPAFWTGGILNIFTSNGISLISRGPGLHGPWETADVDLTMQRHIPFWVEAVWRDDDGTLYLWYHHEPEGVCSGSTLTSPRIGAAISRDDGATIEDLGIIIESGDADDCTAKNGYFAGGHGDFSVIPDRERGFFYFLFTNYAGQLEDQGVVIARMPFESRGEPVGAVMKYHNGGWYEPGLGGMTTPVFAATNAWQGADADSFWGPAVHWNTYLEKYVVLLNRACCKTLWPQEGIYAAFTADLSDPGSWSKPVRLLDRAGIGYAPGYYPQVMGLGEDGTDTLAGERARFFVHGVSKWEISFTRD